MVERASVTQVTQIGVETTPGTAVPANKKLPSISIEAAVKAEVNAFGAQGHKVPTVSALGKEWSEWKIRSDAPTYDELSHLLSSLLVYAAPAQQGGTTAYLWTHAPSATVEDTYKTLTVEQGSSVRAQKAAFGAVTELTIDFDRSGVKLSGMMIARAITDGITLTAAPTALPQIPILADDVDVFADDTNGGLGTTKLTRVKKGQLKIGGRRGPVWVVDSAQSSFVDLVERPITAQLKLWTEADAQGMGLLTTMRNSARKFVRIKATSPTEAGSAIPYSLQVDCAVDVTEPGEFSDDEGVYGLEWTFDLMQDGTWGKWLQVEVVNKQSAL